MTALLLSPHNDDAVLFASFTLLREKPHVVTVFRSAKQEAYGITAETREAEDTEAFQILGVSHEQWPYLDTQPLPLDDLGLMGKVLDLKPFFDHCYAPAIEETGGHEQHDEVGRLAAAVFGVENVTYYTTYRRGTGRSLGAPVLFDPEWLTLKLRALACYRSQIETPKAGCAAHFLGDQREYYTR